MDKLYIHIEDKPVQVIGESDPTMKQLITAIGDLVVPLRMDYFASLVRSIIGQQISVSAASAIYRRLKEMLGDKVTAEALLTKSKDDLREVGLTKQKAAYVKDLAEKTETGQLDLDHIATYEDTAVMEQLINVKGIGKWTAEMFLILTLGREDVLAIDDVGIQRAAKWLYGVDQSERRNILVEKSPLWKPHRSIVSFYLWETVDRGWLATYDSIDAVMQEEMPRRERD